MTIQQLVHESRVLAFTNSSSVLGLMHKASFHPVNEGVHDTVARWLFWTLVCNEASIYSQHIKVTENIILNALSRDFNKSDQSLTKFPTQLYHLRQDHHSTSNWHPEILSPGYCQQQNPRHDQGNLQIYWDQAVWQLGKMVHITHTHRHHKQITGWNPIKRKKNHFFIIHSISANKPFWRNT